MQRPPQFSRRYPWLTLALAIPLVAVLAFIDYQRYVEEDAGDGWKTYRNARFGYEIRLPPSWEVERVDSPGDLKPGLPTQMTTFVQGGVRDDPIPRSSDQPPPQVAPRASVWVNPQGDWCTGNTYSDKRTISVDGVPGDERVCYTYGLLKETCQPRPRCFAASGSCGSTA